MTSTRILTIRILRTFPLILATATLLATLAATASAQNPVPFIDQPLVPDATAPGGPAFTLTVNGAGFVPASVVRLERQPACHDLCKQFATDGENPCLRYRRAVYGVSRSSKSQPWRRHFQHQILLDRISRPIRFVRPRGDLRHRWI